MSRLVTAAVGLACKAVLSSGFCSLAIRGLPILTNALESAARGPRRVDGCVCFASHKHKKLTDGQCPITSQRESSAGCLFSTPQPIVLVSTILLYGAPSPPSTISALV